MCLFFFILFFTDAAGDTSNRTESQQPTRPTDEKWMSEAKLTPTDWFITNVCSANPTAFVGSESDTHTHTQTCGRTLLTGIGMRAHELADSYTHTVTRTLMSERRERAGSSWISMSSGMCEWEWAEAVEWPAGRHLCQIKELLKRMGVCVCVCVQESVGEHSSMYAGYLSQMVSKPDTCATQTAQLGTGWCLG